VYCAPPSERFWLRVRAAGDPANAAGDRGEDGADIAAADGAAPVAPAEMPLCDQIRRACGCTFT